MTAYKVDAIQQTNDNSFNGSDGQLVELRDYLLTLTNTETGGSGVGVISQKPGTAAPTIGQTLDLNPAGQVGGGPFQGQPKFKKVSTYQPNGGRGAMSPEREKSITRQTAAKCAAQVLSGSAENPPSAQTIARVTEDFYAAITADQPATTGGGFSDVPPADTTGLDKPHESDDVPF